MKVSKGQSEPEIVAAAFSIPYMVLGSSFLYQVLIVTQVSRGRGIRGLGSGSVFLSTFSLWFRREAKRNTTQVSAVDFFWMSH